MPGATPQIGDRRAIVGLLGKAGQQRAVERLTGELVAEPGRVLLGYSVVAPANTGMRGDRCLYDQSVHRRPAAR
jgi:hypothetical protein